MSPYSRRSSRIACYLDAANILPGIVLTASNLRGFKNMLVASCFRRGLQQVLHRNNRPHG